MEVQDHVVPFAAEADAECQVVPQACKAARTGRDDDIVQCGMVADDRRGRRLDEVGQVRVGQRRSKRADERGREDDVADEAQSHHQHAHGRDYKP